MAVSSAEVGPLKTLTTTNTKCSRATANSTSMPLLHRAAALEKFIKVILGAYHFPLFGIILTILTWTLNYGWVMGK